MVDAEVEGGSGQPREDAHRDRRQNQREGRAGS